MQTGVKVDSIDSLAVFRVALIKFSETAGAALGDAEGDVMRTISWLENDQTSHWATQIRHRSEALARANEALRQKTVFRDSSGRAPSAVEEQKAVVQAQKKLHEAQEKMAATKQWHKRLQKELIQYKGQMQRFITAVTSDIPSAIGHLGALINSLQEYAALSPGQESSIDPALAAYFSGEAGTASMARGQAQIVDTPNPAAGARGAAAAATVARPRGKAPTEEARKAALPAPIVPANWAIGALSEEDQQIAAQIQAARVTPVDTDKVVIAKGVVQSDHIYLERWPAAGAGDSGWYIGEVAAAGSAFETITIAQLLAARPDWRALLSLPAGYLAILEKGAVTAVANQKDEDVWAALKKS